MTRGDRTHPAPLLGTAEGRDLIEELVDAIAERIAAHVALRLDESDADADRWLSTREAARYLDVHPDTLRKLAAARLIPSEQEAPRCVRYFRASDLDRWRESGGRRLRSSA